MILLFFPRVMKLIILGIGVASLIVSCLSNRSTQIRFDAQICRPIVAFPFLAENFSIVWPYQKCLLIGTNVTVKIKNLSKSKTRRVIAPGRTNQSANRPLGLKVALR